jgi:hypothetical protein
VGGDDAVAGFDFGSGCKSGSGTFIKSLPERYSTENVGIIPMGKFDIVIRLSSSEDIDITLFDLSNTTFFAEGKALVQWCEEKDVKAGKNCGMRNATEETIEYEGMIITYSGYEGDGVNWGNEFIRIQGETSVNLMMKAYAYKTGNATVDYEWGASQTECCKGVKNACGGTFSASLEEGQVLKIGEIPVGKGDLNVTLLSSVDIDIQLYDLDDTESWQEGQAIIGYCEDPEICNFGNLTSDSYINGTYRDRIYTYSGYDGFGRSPGNEYITIDGVTNRNLLMTFYGYKQGNATVVYSYTEPQEIRAASP